MSKHLTSPASLDEYRAVRLSTRALTAIVWLLAAAIAVAWTLRIMDRSKATPNDALEVATEPVPQALSWGSLAAHFGALPQLTQAAPPDLKVQGVVLNNNDARAVLQQVSANDKVLVVKVGSVVPDVGRVRSINATEVVVVTDSGAEKKLPVPKPADAKTGLVTALPTGGGRVSPLVTPPPQQRVAQTPSAAPQFVPSQTGLPSSIPEGGIALPGQSIGNLPANGLPRSGDGQPPPGQQQPGRPSMFPGQK